MLKLAFQGEIWVQNTLFDIQFYCVDIYLFSPGALESTVSPPHMLLVLLIFQPLFSMQKMLNLENVLSGQQLLLLEYRKVTLPSSRKTLEIDSY